MGARNATKAKKAIAKLHKEGFGSKGGSVVWLQCDISTPKSAQAAARRFLESGEKRLDILGMRPIRTRGKELTGIVVNNAGILRDEFKLRDGGVQDVIVTKHVSLSSPYSLVLMFVNSHFGPFALTEALLPILTETAKQPGSDVRIIDVCPHSSS